MSNEKKGRSPDQSEVIMREMVMPHHANPQNTIFGGVVMSWIDLAAAMAANLHAKKNVVTAHIDSIDFKAPIKVGHHAIIVARLHHVGRSSMDIKVEVFSENPLTGDKRMTTSAYLTFVALDDLGRPTVVPPLLLETEKDRENSKEIESRKKIRRKE